MSLTAVAIVALLLAYAQRRNLAREAVVGWLEARGIDAEAEVGTFGLGGASGRVRVGGAENPDFSAENVDVTYAVHGFWSGEPFGLQIRSVRLTRPVLKARWRDGKLSLGSLDPLIEEFSRRPPRPDVRQPAVTIDDGLVRLDTPYGPALLRADAKLNDGKLLRLTATLEPTRLRGGRLDAAVGPGSFGLVTRDDRVDLALDLAITRFRGGEAHAAGARIRLTGQAPYPDLKRRRSDGVVALRLLVDSGQLGAGADELRDAHLAAIFRGRSDGWLETLTLRGAASVDGHAASARIGEGAHSGILRLGVEADQLAWRRTGGDAVSSPLRLTASVERLAIGDLGFQTLGGKFDGEGAWDRRGLRGQLNGSASGHGSFAGMGPLRRDDLPEIAVMKRAARDFDLNAPGLGAALASDGLTLSLPTPIRIRPRTGGEVLVRTLGAAPLFRKDAGALALTSAGGGLPQGEAVVRRFALSSEGLNATTGIKLKANLGPLREASLDADGELRVADGAARFRAARCAKVQVARLELGENDAETVRAELCQGASPLFTYAEGRWRVQSRARNVSAVVPFLQTRVSEATGTADFGGGPAGLSATAMINGAHLTDTAAPTRFNPLRATGRATLQAEVWKGVFVVSDPAGRRLGEAVLRHDGAAAKGGVELDSGPLIFAEGGLQPAELSPLAAAIGSPATGEARFTGAFAWTAAGATSHGRLVLDRVAFQSTAGAVVGLSGDLAFNSLAPLAAAPGQSLTAERINTVAPLDGVRLSFGLADQVLTVSGGEAAIGGGRVWLDTFDFPLALNPTWRGVLNVEGVQVADLVEASPFGSHMDLKAKVSGRVPFEVSPTGTRISNGELHAVEAGRLSIRRDALGGVQTEGATITAEGATPAIPVEAPNAFADFAYQAMENLAFNQLSAGINSLPEGRLGVLFRIKGEHSPPKRQEIRISAIELLNRKFLNRPLPLPSGVKVDLTLDTSLNLDQLLKDYAGYQQLRHSDPVQPRDPIKGED